MTASSRVACPNFQHTWLLLQSASHFRPDTSRSEQTEAAIPIILPKSCVANGMCRPIARRWALPQTHTHPKLPALMSRSPPMLCRMPNPAFTIRKRQPADKHQPANMHKQTRTQLRWGGWPAADCAMCSELKLDPCQHKIGHRCAEDKISHLLCLLSNCECNTWVGLQTAKPHMCGATLDFKPAMHCQYPSTHKLWATPLQPAAWLIQVDMTQGIPTHLNCEESRPYRHH